jgi:hypothetical protein
MTACGRHKSENSTNAKCAKEVIKQIKKGRKKHEKAKLHTRVGGGQRNGPKNEHCHSTRIYGWN